MRTWEDNAKDFGGLFRQDKDFRLAALVACSVRREVNRYSESSDSLKCSTHQFAEKAGVSQSTVSRYFRNWEAMAAEGLVDNPDTLTPNDVDSISPTTEVLERWEELPANPTPMRVINREPIETLHALSQPVPFDYVRESMVTIGYLIDKVETNLTNVNDPDELSVFRHRVTNIINRLTEMLDHVAT